MTFFGFSMKIWIENHQNHIRTYRVLRVNFGEFETNRKITELSLIMTLGSLKKPIEAEKPKVKNPGIHASHNELQF